MARDAQPPDAEPRPITHAGTAPTADWARPIALFALSAALIGLSLSIALPFLPAITWAVALAILAWPMHRWITRLVTNRGFSAAISLAIVATVILATGLFATYQIGSETADAARRMEDGAATGGAIRGKIASVPLLHMALEWSERVGIDVQDTARKFVESNAQNASNLARGSAAAAIQFLLAMFILYYLFRDRDTFLDGLRGLLPLSEGESNFLMGRAADSVHATLYSTVVTSLIDSVAFGLTFWATGVPAPMLWSVIMFLLSLLPILGAGLIWVPATVYLIMDGNWPGAIALIAVGVVTATFVDNILYARLAGGRMRMHNVPVLLAFLGGLAVFGVSGMILGPVILAVTEAMLEVWKRRMADANNSPVPGDGQVARGARTVAAK
jgi:predicted PurR-regulated permease PerM